jgi:hypothetical protein
MHTTQKSHVMAIILFCAFNGLTSEICEELWGHPRRAENWDVILGHFWDKKIVHAVIILGREKGLFCYEIPGIPGIPSWTGRREYY